MSLGIGAIRGLVADIRFPRALNPAPNPAVRLRPWAVLRLRKLAPLIGAAVVLAACSGGSGRLACRIDNSDSAALDTEFITREFDMTAVPSEGLQIRYLATQSESRCPIGVQCVRAGEASISVELEIEGAAPEQFVLSTSDELDGNQTSATYMGYEIRLLDVIPYPESGRDVAQGDRCAEFVVSGADG